MIETPLNVEDSVDRMSSSLRNVRLIDQKLIADPVDLKGCVMKTGSMKDLYVCDTRNYSSQCVVADEIGSVPYEIDKRIKEAICGDVYTGFKLQYVDNNKYKRAEMIVIKVISLHKVAQLKQSCTLQEDPVKEICILQKFNAMSGNVCDQID